MRSRHRRQLRQPAQFGPLEGYDRYRRHLERDLAWLREAGADAVLVPSVAEMYPEETLVFVEPTRFSDHVCSTGRPGHFRGAATVVAKLFRIVAPDVACFGEQDAQQLAIIRRMVRDLDFPVEIVGVPSVRAGIDLALSSRDTYSGSGKWVTAPVPQHALKRAGERILAGESDASRIRAARRELVAGEPLVRLEQAEVVNAEIPQPLDRLEGRVLVAAAQLGRSRLIDKVAVEVLRAAQPPLSGRPRAGAATRPLR